MLSALGQSVGLDRQAAVRRIFQRGIEDFGVGDGAARVAAMDSATVSGTPAGARSGAVSPRLVRSVMSDRILEHFQNRGFIGWQACAVLAQHEIVNRACAIPAEDAIAHGYRLVCSSCEHSRDSEHDADEARWLFDLKRLSDRMEINDVCVRLNYKKKVFGVGMALPRVDGADYEAPFNLDGVKEGAYHGFAVIDPYWLTFEFENGTQSDPASASFYEPTWYRLPNGTRVHKSWLIKIVNAHVPDILKPTYFFGGIPLTQMIYERVFCADKIANEAPLLAMTKRLLVADANVEELVKDSGYASRMMKAINYFRDNFSIFFKKPSSQVQQIDTTLSEFDQLIMTQYQLVACIAQMPATKLLKVTPSGFQSTGSYEWDDYAQSLLCIQRNDYMPLLEMHYRLLLRSLYPDRNDLSVSVVFNPIDMPKRQENASVGASMAQTANTYIQSGVITPEEARQFLRSDDLGMFGFLDPEMPDILKRIQAAKDPANQHPGGDASGIMSGADGVTVSGTAEETGGADPGERYSAVFTEAVREAERLVAESGNRGDDESASDGRHIVR